MKRILDVGNCMPDHAAIKRFFAQHFDCEVAQAHQADDALPAIKSSRFDLVLVNRKLDVDYSDGIEVIRLMKDDPETSDVPVMLITNLPAHQDAAEAIGAMRGFGKLEYDQPETLDRVRAVLGA